MNIACFKDKWINDFASLLQTCWCDDEPELKQDKLTAIKNATEQWDMGFNDVSITIHSIKWGSIAPRTVLVGQNWHYRNLTADELFDFLAKGNAWDKVKIRVTGEQVSGVPLWTGSVLDATEALLRGDWGSL